MNCVCQSTDRLCAMQNGHGAAQNFNSLQQSNAFCKKFVLLTWTLLNHYAVALPPVRLI